MKIEYKRFPGETDDELIYRVCRDKDRIGSWELVAGVLNALTGNNYSEACYRKKYQSFVQMFEANRKALGGTDKEIADIQEQRRLLEQEKIRLRDERAAWNKQNYVAARVEKRLDLLEEKLGELGRAEFPGFYPINIDSDTDLLVILSDFHIGANFDNHFGKYNSQIAKERLFTLFVRIDAIQKRHHCKNCYVSLQGDLINGNIHKSIQLTNAENVVEQIKTASDLVANFCYGLCALFENVELRSVVGNHTRLDRKEDSLHDERLDDLVAWVVSKELMDVGNFRYVPNELDTGIAAWDIRGKRYVAVHGDYDDYSSSGVQKLTGLLGYVPYAVLYGHLHSPSVEQSSGGVKMIRGGSLCGSGDQYTLEHRLSGSPSQMVCVCDYEGVVAYYPVELKE